MKITNDRTIQISRRETLTLKSSAANITRFGAETADTASKRELSLRAPHGRDILRIQATSTGFGDLTVTSSTGDHWTTALFPGSNLFEFVVEPEAEEWYCVNDTGNPSHPVSKGDSMCSVCGGKVIHGGR
jgi:hypothetical protein